MLSKYNHYAKLGKQVILRREVKMKREEVNISTLKEAASMSLKATSKILKWICYIGANVDKEFWKVYGKKDDNIYRKFQPVAYVPDAIPDFYVCVAAPRGYKWETRTKKDVKNFRFFFFLIGIHKSSSREFNLEVGYGSFNNVESKNMGTFDLARKLLNEVNDKRVNKDEIDKEIKGDYWVAWYPFFKIDSDDKIGELAERIKKHFEDWLKGSSPK